MVELVGGCLVGSNCLDAQKVLGVWTGVFGTCLYFFLMTMTFYLHVCSHAQDWSMLSQSSVTSLVQQGLSYCTHTYMIKELKFNSIKRLVILHRDTIKTGERVEYKKKGGECQGGNGVQIELCIMVRETPGFCRWL